jgi:membrane-bound lytic murein transglycosylase A
MTQLLRSFNGGIWMNEIGCAYRFLQVIKDMRLVKRFLIRIIIVSCGLLPGQQCLSEPAAEMTLSQTDYRQLPSWEQDDHSRALLAFRLSCTEILRRDPQSDFNAGLKSVALQQWQRACQAAMKIHQPDQLTARRFFETWFAPYHVSNEGKHEGLFTGYYMPLLHARLKPSKKFSIPIHALPNDLVKVDLGLFRPEFAGKSIVGQVRNNMLFPYPDRKAIIEGMINGKARTLAWSDNPIDVFFAQVQGSAVIELPNKRRFIIGYAGDNGRRYSSIGKILVTNNELTRQTVSMQSIRIWLANHPDQVNAILNQNASYVFFKVLPDKNPLGTEKVPLTPERSLAVDNRYIPFGAPVWLSTAIPDESSESLLPFHHLLIAQDTGGAIKGVVRGDVYWGTGDKAEFIAGHMNSPGEYWILLPKENV